MVKDCFVSFNKKGTLTWSRENLLCVLVQLLAGIN